MNLVRADLHMHTRASDGTLTPKELLKEIVEKDIKLFSVTDHDSIGSLEEMQDLTEGMDIKFIPGVEVSSIINGEQFHILAYNFDKNNKELMSLIENNDRLLQEKDDNSIKQLIDAGYDIDFKDYLAYEHDPSKGGWKTLNFLIDRGICKNIDEFFNKIFVGERALKYPNFPHPKEVIETIKKANGIVVLAHPKYGKSQFELDEMIELFKNWGVDGIECYHPHHDEDTIKYLVDYCTKNNLIITGGSDYHGGLISKRSLGTPEFYARYDLLDK
ncbi:TPA: PHP domain-containing protein [Clostridium perfringens]|nr:PHP domain-containing protein [Clostridium perfringens]